MLLLQVIGIKIVLIKVQWRSRITIFLSNYFRYGATYVCVWWPQQLLLSRTIPTNDGYKKWHHFTRFYYIEIGNNTPSLDDGQEWKGVER